MSRRSSDVFTRPNLWLVSGVIFVAFAMAALIPPASVVAEGPPCGESTQPPRRLDMHAMRTSILCLVDRVRLHYGLNPLRYNVDLRTSATLHSRSMVNHDYFAHDGPGGSVDHRLTSTGYLARVRSYSVGENIGGGRGRRYGSPLTVYRAWMHSPPHRRNILDPQFRDFGVGVSRGFPDGLGGGAATYTLDFGARR